MKLRKFRNLFFTILLFITISNVVAQVTPCFTAEENRGCAPFELKIHDCSGGTNKLYEVTGPNSFDPSFNSVYTLTTPGFYSIKQWAGTGNVAGTTPLEKIDYIEVLASPVPDAMVQICEGRNISIQLPGAPYEEYQINPGDGSAIATIAAGDIYDHQYTNTNARTITINGIYQPGNCGNTQTLDITPFTSLIKPEIESILTEEGKISLQFNTDSRFKYRIIENTNGGSFQVIDSILFQNGLQSIELNRAPQSNFYSYIIETYDDCGNVQTSDQLSTIFVTLTNGNNEVVVSSSTSNPDFTQFTLFKNNQTVNLSASDFPYKDTDIECGKEYCYKITGLSSTGSSTTYDQCIIGQSNLTPSPLADLSSTVEAGVIKLSWENKSPVKNYFVQELINGTPVSTNILKENFYLKELEITNSICFQVNYTDICNNTAPVSNTCPLIIKLEKDETSNTLTWSDYQGTGGPYSYTLIKKDSQNQIISQTDVTGVNTFSEAVSIDEGIFYYQIVIEDANGKVSESNTIEAKNEIVLLIPSAFSPNGDGINDQFIVEGKFIKSLTMTIFNNWGEAIFYSDSLEKGWNGRLLANDAPSGTYAYIVEATDFQDNMHTKSGTVTLLR